MKILIAGFKGDDNSAKILLDYIKKVCNEDILYLENDFEISSKQIEEKLLIFLVVVEQHHFQIIQHMLQVKLELLDLQKI